MTPYEALLDAAMVGARLNRVKRLILETNSREHNAALTVAAAMGNLEIVKLLIPVSNPKQHESNALQLAAGEGHLDVVRALIPVSDPKASESRALLLAAKKGYFDIVKALIPVSDPTVLHGVILANAVYKGHQKVVNILIPVSNVDTAAQHFIQTWPESVEKIDLLIAHLSPALLNRVYELVKQNERKNSFEHMPNLRAIIRGRQLKESLLSGLEKAKANTKTRVRI